MVFMVNHSEKVVNRAQVVDWLTLLSFHRSSSSHLPCFHCLHHIHRINWL
jgi:hypothetical protein